MKLKDDIKGVRDELILRPAVVRPIHLKVIVKAEKRP